MEIDTKQLFKNGLRVLLTSKCNYKCYFCHNEGIKKNNNSEEDIDEKVIINFIRAGVRSITFSGGEPLLYFSKVIKIMTEVEKEIQSDIFNSLDITIVTNGKLLDAEKVEYLCELSNKLKSFKINISLHSYNEATYSCVTKTNNNFKRVLENIKFAIKSKITVSLNYVLLNNYNTAEKELKGIIDLAKRFGIKRIKLIEFLVTQQNSNYYSSFYRIDSLIYNYRFHAQKIICHNKRRQTYILNNDITLDFIRCPCALGCHECAKTREIELIPGNLLLPCIARPKETINAMEESAFKLAKKVVKQLSKMEKIYGNYSPSLIVPPEIMDAKAVFNVSLSNNNQLLNQENNIIWFRSFESKKLIHSADVLIRSNYKYSIEQLNGDSHSRFLCYSEQVREKENLSWQEITYMDSIYDFSRTRAEINNKKASCLDFHVLTKEEIEERTVLLRTPWADQNIKAYYRELKYLNITKRFVDICRIKEEPWPAGEPLTTAKSLCEKYDFQILPIINSEIHAKKVIKKLKNKYRFLLEKAKEIYINSNDDAHDINHALRVAEALFKLSYKEDLEISEKAEALFLAAIMHDIGRTNGKHHSEASAQKAIELMYEAKVSENLHFEVAGLIKKHSHINVKAANLTLYQKLIQDADFLDCFSLEMIPRAFLYKGEHTALRKNAINHIIKKCLYAEKSDFHFNSTRLMAYPGWLFLNSFISNLDANYKKIQQPYFL